MQLFYIKAVNTQLCIQLYASQTGVCEAHSACKVCLVQGSRGMPLQKILKIRYQETKFGGISATKIASGYELTEVSSKYYMLVLSGP